MTARLLVAALLAMLAGCSMTLTDQPRATATPEVDGAGTPIIKMPPRPDSAPIVF